MIQRLKKESKIYLIFSFLGLIFIIVNFIFKGDGILNSVGNSLIFSGIAVGVYKKEHIKEKSERDYMTFIIFVLATVFSVLPIFI
ncbi:hypothetical protein [Miniphocaeibacter massiliensis]|uniref:hypothetical protein n=1 Tax=Miniphocaeibacter massiliensis TaxID=2041841 RepID=UPI000C1C14F0|nr:hypothetical protein [Miniphocaeibacter massiliensis]